MGNILDSSLCPVELLKGGGVLAKPGVEAVGQCPGLLVKPRFNKDVVQQFCELELEIASWHGVVRDIQDGETIPVQWGVRPTKTGIVSLRNGTVVGMTLALEETPTIGQLDAHLLINGVAQNGPGQTFTFNAQTGFFEYGSPISLFAGDTVDVCVRASGGFAPSGTNGTLTVYYTQSGFIVSTSEECETDELVKATPNDLVSSTLIDALCSSDNSVDITVVNPGANEKLDIRAVGGVGAEFNSWVGTIRNLEADEVAGAKFTSRPGLSGITALGDGQLLGITVTSDTPISTGSISSNVLINGISQNAAGQTLSGSTQTQVLQFLTPISFSQGDVIDLCTRATSTFSPTTNLTVAIWYRLT